MNLFTVLLIMYAVVSLVMIIYQKQKYHELNLDKEEAEEKYIEIVTINSKLETYNRLNQIEITDLNSKLRIQTKNLNEEKKQHELALKKIGELSHQLDEYRNIDEVKKSGEKNHQEKKPVKVTTEKVSEDLHQEKNDVQEKPKTKSKTAKKPKVINKSKTL